MMVYNSCMSFSPKQFREAIQQATKIQQRFDKFLVQCKKHNMEFIAFMLEEFQKIIAEKETLLLKVNSIFALQMMLQTCEYPIVEMVQAFLLPHLQDVALYQAQKRTYAKTSLYFREKGYPPSTPNIEQLSHNYVTIVTQFVFMASKIKQTYYFFNDRLNIPSAFKQLANKLKAKGLEPRQLNSKQMQQLQNLHQLYEANIQDFQNYETSYVNFFKNRVQTYLMEGAKSRQNLDVRKLLKNGDSWLTSEIIGCLHDALLNNKFQVRRHALGMINQLFVCGDVEAIMIVNEGEAIEQIFQRIVQIKGNSDLGRGAQIYPQIEGQLELKKNFYIDFLRCVQTWAKLCPTAIYLISDEQSKVSRFYRQLKDKQFIFPSNDILSKYTKEFEQNMKKNELRNHFIIQELNEGDTSKNRSLASNKLSKYSHKISLIKEMRESTILSLSQIQKMIQDGEMVLRNISKNERDLTKNMRSLNYFTNQFQKKFQLIQESVTESKLVNLYERGMKCLDKIQQIGPYYQDYQNGKIDYLKFSDCLINKFSQIQKSKTKSKMSDILSKLSKSKDVLSRSGLDLSKSVSKSIHPIRETYPKNDQILEKSANYIDRGQQRQSNTRTFNMSNLEDPSKYSDKHKIPSKIQQQPAQHHLHSEESQVSQYSHSSKQSNKEKGQTAKFILHQAHSQNSQHSKKSPINSNISPFQKSSPRSSMNSNKLQSKLSHHSSNHKLSSQNRQPSKNNKPKQQFSDNSWSSDKSDNEQHHQQNIKRPSVKLSAAGSPQNSKNKGPSNETLKSKTRQIFSDSSFSQYNESNQNIREAIDKEQNPDFKMIFKQKAPQQSQNSKMSKLSKVPSHDHYMAVLQSLAAKSNHDITDKQLSHFSKDKSTSQLPPKSNFDYSNKLQNQRQYNVNTSNKQSKVNFDSQMSSDNHTIKEEGRDSNILYHKMNNQQQLNYSNAQKSKLSKEGSKITQKQKNSGSFIQNQMESNSMNPPHQYDQNSLSKLRRQKKQLTSEQSNSIKSKSPVHSHISKQAQSQGSKLSEINYPKKQIQVFLDQSQPNSKVSDDSKDLNKQTASQLNMMKQKKINQIKQLQQKIQMLKGEEKQLYAVRADWQSPTRPQTLRTALSPRFRNNNTNSQSDQSDRNQQSEQTRKQMINNPQKIQQRNFDVVQLFKPPQGKLIYSRLYRKQLQQVKLRQKRKILKGRDLVFRNDDIEVGLMIHRDIKDLKIIYYVTSSKYIKTFLFKIQPSNKLAVHAIPGQLSNLEPRKQYRIYLFAEVMQFPYKMPQIQFKYHPQLLSLQQNLFLTNEVNHFTSIIPFFFIKFIVMSPTTLQQLNAAWSNGILRGQQTAYSRKILPKHFYILQYFPDMVNLQNKEYQNIYGVECEYGSTRFLLRIVIKINKFLYIQGVLTAFRDRQNSEKIMEYTICCINHLLAKQEQII